ncbi:RodZ domain-containing protein [Aliikangiella coralliicola]|uniref:DUF4115 domain-containing protein n=1 Tax=Aliikangiella coralliicola TaxID=2592383 RepID=A0A545UBV2_9GAMM|nr:RodZ domain-containing protein [Aliikangiella coralliicola]TQV86903.1 DUF4115 domain-containing protein [Aliikangiella coralliicola]
MDVEPKNQEQPTQPSIDIGALLVEARENKNLSNQDIADQMNLTVAVITKIENNQFKQDIPLAFIRGYLRSYAQKVGVDPEMVCTEFDVQTQTGEEPVQGLKPISSFKVSRREINSSSAIFKIITYLIVISLVTFAGWEAWKRFSPASKEATDNSISLGNSIPLSTDSVDLQIDQPVSTDQSEAEVEENAPVVSEEPALTSSPANTLSQDTTDQTESNVQSTSTQAQESIEQPAETAIIDSGNANPAATNIETTSAENNQQTTELELVTEPVVNATFTFSGDCWVKVTDANNEVLAIGTKRQGKIMPLQGVAPWRVTLGEPSVVKLEFKGEDYDLSQYGAGRSAQFVLEQ